jgi:ATP-dependent DNA helicase DinG
MIDVLAPGGALATAIPDYEDRPEQREMANAVASSIADERNLIVEAGTGTGKTLAYLIPALQSGKRVVVSTGTRTLQEQITRQDIPLLEELLPDPFVAVTLKGVSNYVCQRRIHELGVRGPATRDADNFATIREWARDSPTGDRAELALRAPEIPDQAAIWSQLTTTPETRIGSRCPFFERCFVTRARRQAERADLVLVNHHLFLADLALRSNYPGARVLPDYDVVIFDEGHQLEEVITDHFGISTSSLRMHQLVRDLRHVLTRDELFVDRTISRRFIESLTNSSARLFSLLHSCLASHISADSDRIELPDELFTDSQRQEAWLRLDTALDEISVHTQLSAEREQAAEAREAAHALVRRVARFRDDLATLAERSAAELIYWAELRGKSVFLHGSPIEIAALVNDRIVDVIPTVIVTSATLTTEGSFAYTRSRLGLEEDVADELSVDSPFDYTSQALLYVATDLPAPSLPNFTSACCKRIVELLAITEGRAFVLFTSHRALRAATRLLSGQLPYPILVQGQQPRAALLDSFRRQPGTVLLATGSFWEGVDVPGAALSQVIIDKLPFAPPSDPLTAARMRNLEDKQRDPFTTYQLPRAALALKQGFGRLIRRIDDRGIVSLLDGRLLNKNYGQVFIETLPAGLQRTASIERARRWWSQS